MCGYGKEVRPALPIDSMHIAKPEVGFMDQCRRLERMVGALVAHVTAGDSSQLTIYKGDQTRFGIRVAKFHLGKKLSDFARFEVQPPPPGSPLSLSLHRLKFALGI